MSRGEAVAWLRSHWWQIGVGLLAVGGWVARVEASIAGIREVEPTRRMVESLARLECLKDRVPAVMAGLPCAVLVDGRLP